MIGALRHLLTPLNKIVSFPYIFCGYFQIGTTQKLLHLMNQKSLMWWATSVVGVVGLNHPIVLTCI